MINTKPNMLNHYKYFMMLSVLLVACSTTNSVLPKLNDDSKYEIFLESNIEGTVFEIDGKVLVTAKRATVLIDSKPHSISATPPGYLTKEEYIQPPYRDKQLKFVFMIGDKTKNDIAEEISTDSESKKSSEVKGIIHPDILNKISSIDIDTDLNNDIAVVIGNKIYDKVPNVDFAINDATAFKMYLVEVLKINKDNIIYIENASKTDFDIIFGTSKNASGKLNNYLLSDTQSIYIYYSGHGAPDVNSKKSYLMPKDADPDYLENTGYSTEQLYSNLNELGDYKINVFLDACFSGGTSSGDMLIKSASPLGIRVNNAAYKLKNANILTASSQDQIASWYPQKQHGLFTYLLLNSLLNRPQVKDNYEELIFDLKEGDYSVNRLSRRLFNREQTPTFIIND